jgi:epoxyqueuosine reductase
VFVATRTLSWVQETISRLVVDAPENRLVNYAGQAIFDRPVVGVADGRDPLFRRLRQAVSPSHFLPDDVLDRYARRSDPGRCVRVVVWALPFTAPIREANRGNGWPSRLYSLARNNGGALNYLVRQRLTEVLREDGWAAVAPVLAGEYSAYRSPQHTFSSDWSERHVAYVAGLGSFGLNGCLITTVGVNVRLGSVVTDLPLEVTPRRSDDHRAACLASGGETCRSCIARCPAGAISSHGLDKSKCYAMRKRIRKRHMETYAGQMHMLRAPITTSGKTTTGYSLGCALCQCGVPCEAGPPGDRAATGDRHA